MNKFNVLTALLLFLLTTACSQKTVPTEDGGGELLEEAAVNPTLTPASPSSRLLAPGTKSIIFTVTTQDPSIVKADTSNKTFSSMTKTATSTNNNRTHSFIFSLQANKPYSFYIKAAPKNSPSLKLLTQLYSTVGCANETRMCEHLEQVNSDSKHPLYRKIFIGNVDGSLWQYGLPEFWAHPVYNLGNPDTVKLLVQKNHKLWRTDLLTFDGAFMDNCWRGLEGVRDRRMIEIDKQIDLDLNGVADDPMTRDRAYEYGLQDFLKGLRAGMPNAVILYNAVGGEPDKTWLHTPNQTLKDRQSKPFNYAMY